MHTWLPTLSKKDWTVRLKGSIAASLTTVRILSRRIWTKYIHPKWSIASQLITEGRPGDSQRLWRSWRISSPLLRVIIIWQVHWRTIFWKTPLMLNVRSKKILLTSSTNIWTSSRAYPLSVSHRASATSSRLSPTMSQPILLSTRC